MLYEKYSHIVTNAVFENVALKTKKKRRKISTSFNSSRKKGLETKEKFKKTKLNFLKKKTNNVSHNKK